MPALVISCSRSPTAILSIRISPGKTWASRGCVLRKRRLLMLDFLNNIVVASVIKSAIVIFILLTVFAYLTLIERRVLAKIQGRLGPNRAGPFGFFQPVAD